MLERNRSSGIALFAATAAAAALWGSMAVAQDKLPPTIILGTQQPGTLQHTMATGIAKIATDVIGKPVIVRPHAGSTTHIPLLNKGDWISRSRPASTRA